MSKRAEAQPFNREVITFEEAFTCGWMRGYVSLAGDTLEDMDRQQTHDLGVFTRTFRVVPAIGVSPQPTRGHETMPHASGFIVRGPGPVSPVEPTPEPPRGKAYYAKVLEIELTEERAPTGEPAPCVWREDEMRYLIPTCDPSRRHDFNEIAAWNGCPYCLRLLKTDGRTPNV